MDGLFLDYALFISKCEANKKSSSQSQAKTRLKERLDLFGFKQEDVTGDGNCQFHAVAKQIQHNYPKDTQYTASKLRSMAVEWLRKSAKWNPWKAEGSELKNFVDEDWDKYCNRMSRSGQWGDHVTLIALVESLNVGIRIISSVQGDQFMTEIDPSSKSGDNSLGRKRVFFLGHWSEYHYVSLIEEADMAMTISNFDRSNLHKLEIAHSTDLLFKEPPKLTPATPAVSPAPEPVVSEQNSEARRVIKVKLGEENRRLTVEEWPKDLASLNKVFSGIFTSEKNKMPTSPYILQFKNDDGKMMTITEDCELRKALDLTETRKNRMAVFAIESFSVM